jgi:membrane dipeptidase
VAGAVAIDRRRLLSGVLGGAVALGGPVRAEDDLAARAIARGPVIDSLTISRPDVDPRDAYRAGLQGSVVDLAIYPREFAAADAALGAWQLASAPAEAPYKLVLKHSDFAAARQAGKYAVVLACQDASILGAPAWSVRDYNLRNLRRFHARGLRVLQMTHNDRNGVGDSYLERYDAGLSWLGEAVVAEMNRLGMLVDLSHCSDQTTLQAIGLSKRPSAVTHAGCRALMGSKRNKPDEVIRRLAETGGYFGVFNYGFWLTSRADVSVEVAADHVEHVVKVGGIDLVGFGSDHGLYGDTRPQAEQVADMETFEKRNAAAAADPVNGHATIDALNTPRRMEVMARALARRGWKEAALEKFLGGNFSRVFLAACG